MSTETNQGRMLAVVTGASSGIGLELARQFAGNGFDVIVAAENPEIAGVASELAATGAAARAVQADLATEDGVETLARAISEDGRVPDAVAINAGVGVGGPFRQTDLNAELRLVDLNCRSAVHLAKRLVPPMCRRGSGRILFTASQASFSPGPFEAVYAASKAFVFSLSESLRNELADDGVSVTALLPGPTETNFFHRAGMDDTKAGSQEKDDPADVARQGFEGLMAGKDQVVAGSFKTRLETQITKVMPFATRAKMHRGLTEPGSAEIEEEDVSETS